MTSPSSQPPRSSEAADAATPPNEEAPREWTDEELAKLPELRDAFREAFLVDPPADLPARAAAYLRSVKQEEGRLDDYAWAAKLMTAIDEVRSTFPEERRDGAFSTFRDQIQRFDAPTLAAHTTALKLFAEERRAGRFTSHIHCLRAAAKACRLTPDERQWW